MSTQFYHLVVFLACLASLLALILTGHDNSPLLQSILSGTVGGTAVGGMGALFRYIIPSSDAGSGSTGNQSGYSSIPYLVAIFLATLGIVAGCAALKTDKVATSCASASAAIKTLTLAKHNGFIGDKQQLLIDDAIAIVSPICTDTPEPTPSAATISALNSAVAVLTSAASEHPGGS